MAMSKTQARTFLGGDGARPTLSDADLTRLQDYVAGELGQTSATLDDLGAFIYDDLTARAINKEYGMAQDRVVRPTFR